MNPARKRILGVLALVLTVPLALYFSSFWWMPWLVRERFLPQVERMVRQEVAVGGIRFHPGLLRLQLDQVVVRSRGEVYFAADSLQLDLAPASWWEKRPHLRQFLCRGFTIWIVRRSDGTLNWSDLGASQSGYRRRSISRSGEWKLPILAMDAANMVDGRIIFIDRTLPNQTERTVENIDLQLAGLDTATSSDNRLALTASLQNGGSLQWIGSFSLQPLRSGGTLRLHRVDLGQHREYLSREGAYSLDQALLSAEVEYLYDPRLGVSPLRVKLPEGRLEGVRLLRVDGSLWFSCSEVTMEKALWEPLAGKIEIHRILLRKPFFEWRRLADGRQELIALWMEEKNAPAEGGWTVVPRDWWIGRVAVREMHLAWRDEMHRPARVLSWFPVHLDLEGYETSGEEPWLLTAFLGREYENLLRLTAELTPDPLAASAKLTLRNFPLGEWTTYLQPWLPAQFSRGFLQAATDIEFAEGAGGPNLTVSGTASLDDGEFLYGDLEIPPLSWSSLTVDRFRYDHKTQRLDLGIIDWVEPTFLLERSDPNRNAFWQRFYERDILWLTDPSRQLQVSLQEARMIGGVVQYIDEAIKPTVQLQATYLEAYFGPWDNRRETASDKGSVAVPFRGEALINEQAGWELAGRWLPSRLQMGPELTWSGRLRRFSLPWMEAPVEFLCGHTVLQGTLDWRQSGEYRSGRLQTENRFSIENLRLGNQLRPEDAPLQLAVALLQGPDNRLSLDLPFSSELSLLSADFGPSLQKAWQQRIADLVRHPYRILLGRDAPEGTKATVTFAPGSADLQPAGMEFLRRLGQVLQEKPLLRLTVAGNVHPYLDGTVLSRRRMEQAVSQVAVLLRGEEPAPTPQELKEILYMMTFGRPAPFTTVQPPVDAVAERQERTKTTGGFLNRILSARQSRESLLPPPPPLEVTNQEQMEAELAVHFQATQEDLQKLVMQRQKAVVAYLQEETGLDPSRIALSATPPQDHAAAEVLLELTP